MAKNIIKAIELTHINSAAFTGAYQAINPTGLPNACFLIRIINNSNKSITVSYDGVTDQDFIIAGATFQLPIQSNALPNNYIANIKQGTIVYVKAAAGAGLVYLAGYYSPQS